jgi:2-desacetyl-2-hydroxyethyl bacteriochlorophyllide A dehydrogenase
MARALWFVAPRRVEIRPVQLPRLGPGELLIRTAFTGLSGGTELLAYRGQIDPGLVLDEALPGMGGTFRFPFRYGYSAAGTVEASRGPIAEGATVFAFHPHQDRFVAGADDVIALEDLDARTATLFPLVETGLQVALEAGSGLGSTVVVLGLGPVGILAAGLIARAGAQVVGVDPRADRREAAEAFGVGTRDDTSAIASEAAGGGGADLVIEASGNPAALATALELLRHEGTVLVCSWYGTKPVTLDLGGRFHRRRLSIRSTQVSTIPASMAARWDRTRRGAEALRLLRELPVKVLATHVFGFEQAQEAFGALEEGREGLIHAALRFD